MATQIACCLLLVPAGAVTAQDASRNADLRIGWLETQTTASLEERKRWWRDVDASRVRGYLAAGADPGLADRRGWTPLHSAARYNPDAAVALALIAAGADVNARDRAGDTPLHWAAADNASVAVLDALLAAGADVNARDRYGWLPIHSAADRNPNPEVLVALLDAGANPNKRAYFLLFSPEFLLRHNDNMARADKDLALALLRDAR